MPAPPRLDDRTAEQIREELVSRIPMHAPDWTERDPSDPGMALIELFAHLASGLVSRINDTPRACQDELNRLLGVAPRLARPAQALARFTLAQGASTPAILPCDPVSPRALVAAGPARFEICDELAVLPVEVAAVIKARAVDVWLDEDQEQELIAALDAHLPDATNETVYAPTLYETAVLPAPKAGQLPPPLRTVDSTDGALWFALLSPPGIGPDQAKVALSGQILSLGLILDDGWTDHEDDWTDGVGSAKDDISWHISTGALADPNRPLDGLHYAALPVVRDHTAGLLRSGVVRLQLPARPVSFGLWTPPDGLAGAGEHPPALDDDGLNDRLIAWIRASAPSGRRIGLRLAVPNGVEVVAREHMPPELLGRGTGQPGLRLPLSRAPVEPESLVVEGHIDGLGWRPWRRVDSLSGEGGDANGYELNPAAGLLSFGDGVHGAAPRKGELLRARSYRAGGGASGNVPAEAINAMLRAPPGTANLRVSNPAPATGGRDAETPEEARHRIPRAVRHNDRAVSAEDFRDLAMETPGAALGRVEVLPRTRPPEWREGCPGVVTLVVLPASDPVHPERPVPGREELRAVAAWLEPRRLLTTELCVTAPEYVPVSVSVAIELEPGFGFSAVRRWVELGLRQTFAPLPPYGPAGMGWPMGRDVRLEDVAASALGIEGVRLVHATLLSGAPSPGAPVVLSSLDRTTGSARAVAIQPWQLPALEDVWIAEGEIPAPMLATGGTTGGARGETGSSRAVFLPVPVAKERC